MIATFVLKAVVRNSFKALNAHQLDHFLAGWDDHATFDYPGNLSVSGRFTGKAQIREWFSRMFEQYPEIDFTPRHICVESIFDLTGNNQAMVQVDIKLTNKSGVTVSNSAVICLKIRNRKVVAARDYFFYPERLAIGWAEIPVPQA